MIIGIDLDETLVDSSVVWKKAFIEYDVEHLFEPPISWSFPNYPDSVKLRIHELFKDNEMMTSLLPFDGVSEKIKNLKKFGHELIVITARYKELKTEEYVKNLFPEIDKVIVSGFTESKSNVFIKEKIEFWIDDAPHGIVDAQKLGIKTMMISNKNTPYNHHMRDKTLWCEKFNQFLFY